MPNRWWTSLALLAVTASPILAGGHSKCHETTQECLDHMATKMKNSGWIGVELETDEPSGWKVLKVVPGSPAETAGIEPGDVLKALNGVRIPSANEEAMAKARKDWKPGQSVTYTIARNGTDREVTLTLAAWPADLLARWIGEHMLEHVTNDMASAKAK